MQSRWPYSECCKIIWQESEPWAYLFIPALGSRDAPAPAAAPFTGFWSCPELGAEPDIPTIAAPSPPSRLASLPMAGSSEQADYVL